MTLASSSFNSVFSVFEKEEPCESQYLSGARGDICLFSAAGLVLNGKEGLRSRGHAPRKSACTIGMVYRIYLLSLFLQAARAGTMSFSLQEVYLVVSFLSFPVSFLQKDITVFSVQQLIRRMLLLKWRQTYFLSQTQPSQGHRGVGLGVEKENLISMRTSPASSSPKYFP